MYFKFQFFRNPVGVIRLERTTITPWRDTLANLYIVVIQESGCTSFFDYQFKDYSVMS